MSTLSLVFLFAFILNSTDAEAGTHGVEKTFDMDATFNMPGVEEKFPFGKLTFKAIVPNSVKPGDEFYLTNVSYIVTHIQDNPATYPQKAFYGDLQFWVSSENETDRKFELIPGDIGIDIPVGATQAIFSIPEEGGLEVGPFIAGQEGNVIIKADSVGFKMGGEGPDGEPQYSPINIVGLPAEGSDLAVAMIPIDGEAPVITLKGDNPMIVKQGDPYIEPGATAQDNFDGDVSDDIDISGEVDSDTIGDYTITYTVSDSVGNEAIVERTVNVAEPFGEWYTGEGVPSDELGSNGDSYLDLTTGDVYKRDPNTWTKVSNLKGDDGNQGSAILTGSGSPSADAGDIGDLYLDTETGDVYEKTADGWKKVANLQGPAGSQGPKGSAGSDGGGSGDDGGKKGTTKTTTGNDTDNKGKSAKGGKLPKTATSLPTLMVIGILLATVGGLLFIRRRKLMN